MDRNEKLNVMAADLAILARLNPNGIVRTDHTVPCPIKGSVNIDVDGLEGCKGRPA